MDSLFIWHGTFEFVLHFVRYDLVTVSPNQIIIITYYSVEYINMIHLNSSFSFAMIRIWLQYSSVIEISKYFTLEHSVAIKQIFQGETVDSEYLSELTEEEYEVNFVKPHLKGFVKLDIKYLIPFLTRRFTKQASLLSVIYRPCRNCYGPNVLLGAVPLTKFTRGLFQCTCYQGAHYITDRMPYMPQDVDLQQKTYRLKKRPIDSKAHFIKMHWS